MYQPTRVNLTREDSRDLPIADALEWIFGLPESSGAVFANQVPDGGVYQAEQVAVPVLPGAGFDAVLPRIVVPRPTAAGGTGGFVSNCLRFSLYTVA